MSKDSPTWIEDSLYNEITSVIPIACVDLLIVHDGRLLLMLRNNEPGKGVWFTPGGRILKGETLEEAVTRLLGKETGLEATRVEQKGTMAHIWPEIHTVTTFYRVDVASGNVEMNDEHSDYRWITGDTGDLHPFVTEMIERAGIF
ncbi:GDP-mannose mannosyl hydrolase [subsurface metagenome]